ncbi:MAG: (2Fe-2S)-binding protein, partial [Bacillota bacterium]
HHRPTLLHPPRTSAGGWVLCDCERVTAARVLAAWDPEQGLDGLRRRVRLGMGVCQGALCLPRAAELLVGAGLLDAGTAACQLADCLRERWRGLAPLEIQGASRTATTFFHALAPREASTLAL